MYWRMPACMAKKEVCPPYDISGVTAYNSAAFMHFFLAMIGVRKKIYGRPEGSLNE